MLISEKPEELTNTVLQGGIIAYPTEAVFGLGCVATHEKSIQKLITLKGRSPDKGLILIASSLKQLEPYILPLSKKQTLTILAMRTHPVTWIVPAKPQTSPLLTGIHGSLAIRITKHPPIQLLCQLLNLPLISTSANFTNQPSALTTTQVIRQLEGEIDCILDAKTGGLSKPSTIINLLTHEVIRS